MTRIHLKSVTQIGVILVGCNPNVRVGITFLIRSEIPPKLSSNFGLLIIIQWLGSTSFIIMISIYVYIFQNAYCHFSINRRPLYKYAFVWEHIEVNLLIVASNKTNHRYGLSNHKANSRLGQ